MKTVNCQEKIIMGTANRLTSGHRGSELSTADQLNESCGEQPNAVLVSDSYGRVKKLQFKSIHSKTCFITTCILWHTMR